MIWGTPSVEHSDPAVKRFIEDLVTERLEEYQDMLLRVMRAWMLGTGGEALGRSMMAAFTKLPPTGGAYANARSMYDSISMRLFGASVVWPEIDRIVRNPKPSPPTYPPLVVDRDKLAMQIDTLLDPTLALRTWVYDKFGLVVNPHQARIIAAIEADRLGIPEHWRNLR